MVSSSSRVKLLISEEVELYRHIYEMSDMSGLVDLLAVSEEFDRDKVEDICARQVPDVLLLGAKKLDRGVVEELKEIRRNHPELGVILVFSSFSERDTGGLRELAKAGEGGIAVFLRDSLDQVEQLVRLVLAVSRRQVVLDPALARFLFSDAPAPFFEELTPREKEILNLLARGDTNSAIARKLFVDTKTVEHHLNSIYGKLRATNDFDNKHPRVAVARLYLKETGELSPHPSN